MFILINVISAFHAYKFTHFTENESPRLGIDKLTIWDKAKVALTGINNPKPKSDIIPNLPYEEIEIQSNVKLSTWWIPNSKALGTVILFHGYGAEKSSNLNYAYLFQKMGYNTLLVDFMGTGKSEGHQVTIGYLEAQNVKATFDYVKSKNTNQPILLFGNSMGAAAIMKAINDYALACNAIILECPFGSMQQTMTNRFENMHFPTFPILPLMMFWGSVENGISIYDHNPETYAKNIQVPTLLMYGEKDKMVRKSEINAIFKNLSGKKQLVGFPLAGHENYLKKYQANWYQAVQTFIQHEIQI